jgi:hypothetical protein
LHLLCCANQHGVFPVGLLAGCSDDVCRKVGMLVQGGCHAAAGHYLIVLLKK